MFIPNTQPDNVMLVPAEEGGTQIKLLDFGVAKNLSQPTAGMTTVSGAMLGTPAYMAPEQIKHSAHVDARADIYAIGVMLYEALVGQRPFSGNAIELLSAQLFEAVASPSSMAAHKGVVRPQIKWPEMDRIIAKALAKDPAGRYAQVEEFLADLQKAWPKVVLPDASGKVPHASTASSGVSIPEDHRSSLNRLLSHKGLLLGGALLLGSAGLLVLLSRRTDPVTPLPTVLSQSGNDLAEKPVEPLTLAQRRIAQALRGPREDRRALALAIAEVAVPREELRVLLLDTDPAVSRAALQAVATCGIRGDARLVSTLTQLTQRAGGALGLETMVVRLLVGDLTVQAAVQAATKGAALDPETRLRAKVALSQAGLLKASELRTAVLQAVQQGGLRPGPYRQALLELLRVRDAETLKRLTKALTDSNLRLRSEAAEVLARFGRSDGKDALFQLAQSRPEELSYPLLLATVGDARARTLLAARLRDSSASIRQQAVAGLGALAKHRVQPCDVSVVGSLLSDADPQVSLVAAVAFLALQGCAPSGKAQAPS